MANSRDVCAAETLGALASPVHGGCVAWSEDDRLAAAFGGLVLILVCPSTAWLHCWKEGPCPPPSTAQKQRQLTTMLTTLLFLGRARAGAAFWKSVTAHVCK